MLTRTLDAYKLPTIADVPEIVCELVDEPDEHLTNLGSKGLGEPPIIPTAAAIANAIRDATGAEVTLAADHARGDPPGAARGRGERETRWSCRGLARSPRSSARPTSRLASRSRAAPSSSRSSATGSLTPRRSSTCADVVPRGVDGDRRIGAGTTLAELEVDPTIPDALREACRLAASPQLRNMGTIGGNLLQATRCWYWRLQFPCRLHGGDVCHAREGEHREHAIFANDFCASAHPSDSAAALLALGATMRTDRRELPLAELYRAPD